MPVDIGKWTLNILRFVLPLAYAATLLSSINHLAWFFGISDTEGWVQYSLAGSIDLTCFMLSVYAMFCYSSLSTASKFIIWGVVIALAGFSWFANWEYAVAHVNGKVFENVKLSPFQDFNSIIQSAFVVFGMIYNKIMQTLTKKQPTAEELQKTADEINDRISAQEAVRKAKESERKAKGTLAEKLVATAKEGMAGYSEAKAAWNAAKNGGNNPPVVTAPEQEQATSKDGTAAQEDHQEEEQADKGQSTSSQPPLRQRLSIVPGGKKSTGKKIKETSLCWPVDYVAEKLGLSSTTVRRMAQRTDCLLVAPRRGAKDYITKASFAAYQAAKEQSVS